MDESPLIARRNAARIMMGPLAAFCVSVGPAIFADEDEQERVAADGVARKVEKAKKTKTREEKAEQEALRHFKKALDEYVEDHTKAMTRVGAVESEAQQKTLATALIARRSRARKGDLFIEEIHPLFRRLLAEQLKGPDSKSAQKAVVEGNPGHDEDSPPVAVGVNVRYPRGAARSTVPASVLLTLPTLPACLNYLFVGRSLILIDEKAQVIADFLPAAAPELIR